MELGKMVLKYNWMANLRSNFICDWSYQLKRDCFINKIFYISLIVTTKQKPRVNTQKVKRNEYKHTNMENHQFPKEERNKRMTK